MSPLAATFTSVLTALHQLLLRFDKFVGISFLFLFKRAKKVLLT